MSLAFYDQSVEQHYGKECLKVSNHHAKFCHRGHCGNGDEMFLVSQVISQDHVTKRYSKFTGRSP